MSIPYRLPAHAIPYLGSKPNGQWGGVNWADSIREVHDWARCPECLKTDCRNPDHGGKLMCPANGLQSWKADGGKTLALFWQSVANVDSDGASPSYKAAELLHADPDWQNDTALHFENSWSDADKRKTYSCDSRTFLGVVMPPQLRDRYGLQLGDFCLVCHGGIICGAQLYDIGPRKKLGEFSQGLVGALKLPNDPRHGNDVSDVCTVAFPGSGLHVATSRPDQLITALMEFAKWTRGQ